MSSVEAEIRKVEERFRLAQLHSDASALDDLLDEHMLLLSDGSPYFAKARILEMYQLNQEHRLTAVEWKNVQIIGFGSAAIVICRGDYTARELKISLQFMRIWLKQHGTWKLVAGTVAQHNNE